MKLKTQLFSVDTLHVQVPVEIDTEQFNDVVKLSCNTRGYEGLEESDGGLIIDTDDLEQIVEENGDGELGEFFKAAVEALSDQPADRVYFHR